MGQTQRQELPPILSLLHYQIDTIRPCAAVLFFLKSRYFPRFFIGVLVAIFVLPILATVWVALAFSIQLGAPAGEFFLLEPLEVIQIGLAGITSLIWISYTLKVRIRAGPPCKNVGCVADCRYGHT